MPLHWLSPYEIEFPNPLEATIDGILAVGGDLSPNRLLEAYRLGIFPWYSGEEPILWWFPNPRMVLFPSELKVSKSMRPLFNQRKFRVSVNQNFAEVVRTCRKIDRVGQEGTWINDAVELNYGTLHEMGFAHSCEVWNENDELVGGLYGVALGNVFFGESMFAHAPNASKFGLIAFVQTIQQLGVGLVDCQQETPHLKNMGARPISNVAFQKMMQKSEKSPHILKNAFQNQGDWTDLVHFLNKKD